MTTQKVDQQEQESVSAEDEQIAEQVEQTEDVPSGAEDAPTDNDRPLTLKDLEDLESRIANRVQGRQSNYTAAELKKIRDEVNKTLAPVTDFISRAEEQRVAQMEPEEQAAYWRDRAKKANEQTVTEEPRQDRQVTLLSEQQQQAVVQRIRGYLEGQNADPDLVSNAALWQGWENLDDPDAVVELAKANYRKVAGSKQQTQQEPAKKPAAKRTAPSTAGAPKQSASDFQSESDIYRAFSESEDERVKNTDDLNRELRKLRERTQ